MPVPGDSRRFLCPEETAPYEHLQKSVGIALLDDKGKRKDGRFPSDLRPLFLQPAIISHSKGSAYLEMSKTKVIAAVHGPMEIPKRSDFSLNGVLSCHFKYAPFSCQIRRHHQADNEEKELSMVLQHALEPAVCLYEFPKSQVDVYVTVLENDGSPLAAAITACGLALASSGIPMYDIIVGASLRLHGDTSFLDPTCSEEYKVKQSIEQSNVDTINSDGIGCGNLTIAYLPSLELVTAYHFSGHASCESLIACTDTLTGVASKLQPVVQNALLTNFRSQYKRTKS